MNKCGGGSIHKALGEYCQSAIKYTEMHGEMGGRPARPRIDKMILFVRDPIEAFISGYYYCKKRRHIDPKNDLNALILEMKRNATFRADIQKRNLHFYYTLDKYLVNYTNTRCIDWFFVGTTEHIREDFQRLMQKLTGELSWPPLEHLHRTKRSRSKSSLSPEAIHYLRNDFLKPSYECLRALHDGGYLPEGYYEKACSRMDYMG